jgi:hypothetical protein
MARNWHDLPERTRKIMWRFGDFSPTLKAEDRLVKGYSNYGDEEIGKTYWDSDDLRDFAQAFTEVADFLEERAQEGVNPNNAN